MDVDGPPFLSSVMLAMKDRVDRPRPSDGLHSIVTHPAVPYGRAFTQYRTDGTRILWSHPDWLREQFPPQVLDKPADPLHVLTGIPVYRLDG